MDSSLVINSETLIFHCSFFNFFGPWSYNGGGVVVVVVVALLLVMAVTVVLEVGGEELE